jgi:hypothetical protein
MIYLKFSIYTIYIYILFQSRLGTGDYALSKLAPATTTKPAFYNVINWAVSIENTSLAVVYCR